MISVALVAVGSVAKVTAHGVIQLAPVVAAYRQWLMSAGRAVHSATHLEVPLEVNGVAAGEGCRCQPPRACCHRAAATAAACACTAQHSTAQHSTAQHSTAQHSTAQHSTAQHSTAQHSTAQHSTARRSTALRQPPACLCCRHPARRRQAGQQGGGAPRHGVREAHDGQHVRATGAEGGGGRVAHQ